LDKYTIFHASFIIYITKSAQVWLACKLATWSPEVAHGIKKWSGTCTEPRRLELN
jgi:hypothetical protein